MNVAPARSEEARSIPGFAEILAGLREVLTVGEIAEATGVKERQVHHWSSGDHLPKGPARDRLLTLHLVVQRLRLALDPEQTKIWLLSPQGAGARPLDLIRERAGTEVLESAAEASRREGLDDEYLVGLARNGNTEAYDWLVRRYRGLVRRRAAELAVNADDPEDLIQEGLLGLYKAIRDHMTDQGPFGPFAERSISTQIEDAVGRRVPQNLSARSDEPRPEDDEEIGRLLATLSEVSAELSDLESRTLSLYLEGSTLEDIAVRLGEKKDSVEQAMRRVKRKVGARLRRVGKEPGSRSSPR